MRGTVVAALLIGLSDGIVSVFFSPTLAKILATLLVALVLVFRPQGLFGARGPPRERRVGRWRGPARAAARACRGFTVPEAGVTAAAASPAPRVLLAAAWRSAAYHATNLARIMVLAVFAMGYNLAFGYTGLLSLGHALFFAAGLYATGLLVAQAGWPAAAGAPRRHRRRRRSLAAVTGLLALRTTGTAFMIVTLMFAQAGYLTILYFGAAHPRRRGLHPRPRRPRARAARPRRRRAALRSSPSRLFAAGLLASLALVRAPPGRVLVAVRENAERTRMLGYDPFRTRLLALTLSGLYAGAAGAAYGAALRLCRGQLRRDAVLDPAAALGAARRRRHGARAVRRHRADVLPRRPRRAGHRRHAARRRRSR